MHSNDPEGPSTPADPGASSVSHTLQRCALGVPLTLRGDPAMGSSSIPRHGLLSQGSWVGDCMSPHPTAQLAKRLHESEQGSLGSAPLVNISKAEDCFRFSLSVIIRDHSLVWKDCSLSNNPQLFFIILIP